MGKKLWLFFQSAVGFEPTTSKSRKFWSKEPQHQQPQRHIINWTILLDVFQKSKLKIATASFCVNQNKFYIPSHKHMTQVYQQDCAIFVQEWTNLNYFYFCSKFTTKGEISEVKIFFLYDKKKFPFNFFFLICVKAFK